MSDILDTYKFDELIVFLNKFKTVELILLLELGYIISRKVSDLHYQGIQLIIENGERKIKLLGWGSSVIDPMIPFCQMFSDPNEWEIDFYFASASDILVEVGK